MEIKTKKVLKLVKAEVRKRVNMLINTGFNDVNLVLRIHAIVIPVAAYAMNTCRFTARELRKSEQVIKRERRAYNILAKQAGDERLYLKRGDGGHRVKSMRDVF